MVKLNFCLPALQDRSEHAARWLCVAAIFSLSLPMVWLSLCTALFLFAWLGAGRYAQRWALVRREPFALLCLALLLWAALSVAWSPAESADAWGSFWKYRELLTIPLMLSLIDDPRWGRRMVLAFLAGFGFALAVSYLRWLELLPPYSMASPHGGFTNHIGFSLLLAFGTYAGLWMAREARGRLRLGWALFSLLAFINLFFINTGRTGIAGFLALLPLLLYHWRGVWGLVAGGALALLSFGLLFLWSPTVQPLVLQGLADIEGFRDGNSHSSLGLRLEFWQTTLELIRTHPVLGGGAGSYAFDYRELALERGWSADRLSENPHNEFLMVWSQFGLPGLALLGAIFGVQWRSALTADTQVRYLTHGLLVVFLIGNLFNSLLLDTMEGHFYALLSVALLALGKRSATVEKA